MKLMHGSGKRKKDLFQFLYNLVGSGTPNFFIEKIVGPKYNECFMS